MIAIPEQPKPIRIMPGLVHISPLRLKAAAQSAGGLLLPPGAHDDSKQFLVLGVGPARFRRKKGKPDVVVPVEVVPGDRVLVDLGHGGVALPDGTWIVRQSHLLLKWFPDEPQMELSLREERLLNVLGAACPSCNAFGVEMRSSDGLYRMVCGKNRTDHPSTPWVKSSRQAVRIWNFMCKLSEP
jgi:co-chaperonin GroES (HSP10)